MDHRNVVWSRTAGLTLIELLITLAILAFLFLLLLASLVGQTDRARDAQRRSDLEIIKIAFEDYYNDNKCYPDPQVLQNCGSDEFAPYLRSVPCDPTTNQPYNYQPLADQCAGYRLFARLRAEPAPPLLTGDSCDYDQYNYVVAVGARELPESCVLASPGFSPSSSPSPAVSATPSFTPDPSSAATPSPISSPSPTSSPMGIYGCDTEGVCNFYSDTEAASCGQTFDSYLECNQACGTLPSHLRCNY